LEDLGVDGNMILKMVLKISDGGEDGIRLAQDTGRSAVNSDMKLTVQ